MPLKAIQTVKKRRARARKRSSGAAVSVPATAPLARAEARVEKKVDKLGRAMDILLTSGGAAVGSYLGSPAVGAALGSGLSTMLGKLRGHGDYVVNSLVKPGSERVVTSTPAAVMVSGGGCVRVQRREFVGFMLTSGTASAYYTQAYRINPGNPILFPWLSANVALGFKKWRPLGLVVELISEATEYATAQPLGTFGLAVDYQNYDVAFSSITSAMTSEGAVAAKISENIVFGIECDPAKRAEGWLMVRNGVAPGGDLNKYDLAYLTAYTHGCAATSAPVAQIWVSYDVEFCDPILNGGLNGGGTFSFMYGSSTGVNAAHPCGTAGFAFGDYDASASLIASRAFAFPVPGVYAVVCQIGGSTGTWANGSVTLSGNAAFCSIKGSSGGTMSQSFTDATSGTGCSFVYFVNVWGPWVGLSTCALFTIGTDFTMGSNGSILLQVLQLPFAPSAGSTSLAFASPTPGTWT
nr:MAG: hypothetical protein 2 [Sobelivirales sp.]